MTQSADTPQGLVRLSKRMSELGIASRREADSWIAAGLVTVNGHRAALGEKVAPDAVITVDDKAKREQDERVTILIHKPVGYVSGQAEDGYLPAKMDAWQRRLSDRIPQSKKSTSCVSRTPMAQCQ